MTSFEKDVAETFAYLDMLEERIPGLKPDVDKMRADAIDTINEIFQPWIDLDEGRITLDEFNAIQAERTAADLAKRRAHYRCDDFDEDEEHIHEVDCEDCGTSYEWDEAEHDGEPPPIYFQCEDVTGEDCMEATDDD